MAWHKSPKKNSLYSRKKHGLHNILPGRREHAGYKAFTNGLTTGLITE